MRPTSAVTELQIIRLGGASGHAFEPLEPSEWCAAVEATAGVRLAAAGAATPNPRTGEVVRLWAHDRDRVDAEVELADGSWRPVFRWHASGWVGVHVDFDVSDGAAPETAATFDLAAALSARVVDGHGNLQPDPR